jgi:hypothetical protein
MQKNFIDKIFIIKLYKIFINKMYKNLKNSANIHKKEILRLDNEYIIKCKNLRKINRNTKLPNMTNFGNFFMNHFLFTKIQNT